MCERAAATRMEAHAARLCVGARICDDRRRNSRATPGYIMHVYVHLSRHCVRRPPPSGYALIFEVVSTAGARAARARAVELHTRWARAHSQTNYTLRAGAKQNDYIKFSLAGAVNCGRALVCRSVWINFSSSTAACNLGWRQLACNEF